MKLSGHRCSSRAPLNRLLAFALLTGIAGCASQPGADVSSASAVAVLINRTWVEQDPRGFAWEVSKDEQATEEQFAACVRQAASSRDVAVRVITGTQFRAVVFPDLDSRAAPRGMEALRALIPDPRFRERVDAAGIRYLAVLGGKTRTSETKGGIYCAGGYGGGGCFGLLWWDHESQLSALVVDMHGGGERLQAGIDATGSSWFAMLVALPLAAPSFHEAEGCSRFGQAVAGMLIKTPASGK